MLVNIVHHPLDAANIFAGYVHVRFQCIRHVQPALTDKQDQNRDQVGLDHQSVVLGLRFKFFVDFLQEVADLIGRLRAAFQPVLKLRILGGKYLYVFRIKRVIAVRPEEIRKKMEAHGNNILVPRNFRDVMLLIASENKNISWFYGILFTLKSKRSIAVFKVTEFNCGV